MTTLDLIAEVKHRTRLLAERFPGIRELESIGLQLDYLGDYIAGKNEGQRLQDINIGLLTVREVEPRDGELAELLYEVAEWVREQRGESGWPK